MSRPSRLKQPTYRYPMHKLRVVDETKWEHSFLKSKTYWQKFCDDEEEKLVRVRDSFPKSSYFPIISKLRDSETGFRDIVDFSTLSASRSFDENVPLVDSKSSSSKAPDIFPRGDDGDTRPNAEPVVKISPPTPLKTLPKDNAITIARMNTEEKHAFVTAENKSTIKKLILQEDSKSLDAPTKNSIIPHDGSGDRRVSSKGTCPFHRYEPAVKIFDDDIEKYLRDDPRTNVLPEQKLNELPLLKDVSKYNRIKSEITSGKNKNIKKIHFARNKRYHPDNAVDLTATEISKIRFENKENGISDQQHDFKSDIPDLNCSFALKRLTHDKDLNFEPKLWEEISVGSQASTDRSIVDIDDKLDAAESESPESGTRSPESPSFRDVQRRLRETWNQNINEQSAKLLKSDSDKSSMMPAKSLARSAFSTKFARYEIWRSRSANVLDSIPRILCFQRKKGDKCLSCMHKPLRKINETEDVSSQMPQTEIEARNDSEFSSDDGLSEFYEELRELYLQRKAVLEYSEKIEDSDESTFITSSQAKEDEDIAMSTKIESNESKSKIPKPVESLLSKSPKSLKATSSSLSTSSKISSSDAHTSDDETSSPLAMDNDPSQYKNMAPCHLPTVLLPSMEPLRALRHRKPTTMESRIALMESAKSLKEKSDDEYCDDVKTAVTNVPKEKSQLKKADEEFEEIVEKKDTFLKSPKALVKVRSEQRLTIAEPARRDDLKRGYTCASIGDLSKDSTRGTFGVSRSEAEDGRDEAISSEAIDSASESTSSGSVDAERRPELPLLTVPEISRFLAEPPICNSRLLRRVLPLDSYNLVAPLLGMPIWYPKRPVRKVKDISTVSYRDEEEAESVPSDLSIMVHPPTTKDISTSGDEHKVGQARSNPYAVFLRRPRRKVVTWRPLTAADLKGYDPEATLEMRARNITDRICRDFCEWLRSLGGTSKVIDEDVLRDMFEIDFTAEASRTMQMSMREMPMVPSEIAAARQCPDAGELAMTRKHLIRDAKAESKLVKTMAFGTAIPWELQFVPPRNRVGERWLRCENVIPDLETMDVVWKGITHLESVRAFAKWLDEHPKVWSPDALITAISADSKRHAIDDETLVHPESDVEHVGNFKVGRVH
ncbi:hypothetical protein DMN91_011391 [Ooceraea biroi]|uniref:Uncharacterized protein n=1 Tax=Ooceraea biroi TaxID=2015173 RepID=A0A3L8D570_OOCBI|nr:hypothetical protein DMN91_011391 [Ooceraea biroi]